MTPELQATFDLAQRETQKCLRDPAYDAILHDHEIELAQMAFVMHLMDLKQFMGAVNVVFMMGWRAHQESVIPDAFKEMK